MAAILNAQTIKSSVSKDPDYLINKRCGDVLL
jgi:hypothetical protein